MSSSDSEKSKISLSSIESETKCKKERKGKEKKERKERHMKYKKCPSPDIHICSSSSDSESSNKHKKHRHRSKSRSIEICKKPEKNEKPEKPEKHDKPNTPEKKSSSKGKDGKRGRRGRDGRRGRRGKDGKRGKPGKDGRICYPIRCVDLKGERGCLGLYYAFQVDYFPVTAYGYEKQYESDCPTPLYQSEKGLGIEKVECHKIDNHTYIQFDLCALLNDCSVKGVECTVHVKNGFRVYGSNELGELGQRIYTSYQDECVAKFCLPYYGMFKYFAITAEKEHECESFVSVLGLCIERKYVPAVGYYQTNVEQQISPNAPVAFEQQGVVEGFKQVDPYTIECLVHGVYGEILNAPVGFAVYVNGVMKTGLLVLNVGDLIQVVNQSGVLETLTQASLSLWRVI
jgi:hypothetical protein